MKKKKLVVFASTFPRWKNDSNPPFVYELSKRLTKSFEVHILTPAFPGAKDYEVMDGMQVHRFHYFLKKYEKLAGSGGILPTIKHNKLFFFQIPFFMAAEFFALKKIVKKIQPDIIHAHWIIPQGFITALVHKLTKVPYVVTTHGGDIFGLRGKIPTSMKRYALKKADSITVVSSAIKKEIEKTISKDLKVKVLPMGVDSTKFNKKNKDPLIKKEYGINGPFLLFVGRLSEKKGVKYLIHAMPKILEKNSKIKLLVIGGGELEKELKTLTKKLGLEKNIIFTGPIPNKELPRYYATADIFIGPSIVAKGGDTEGFGLTFVEAGMSGCWLIGTKVGGISDIIKDGKNGFLVKEKSSNGLSRAVIRSFEGITYPSASQLGEFSWENISKRYEEVLDGRIRN